MPDAEPRDSVRAGLIADSLALVATAWTTQRRRLVIQVGLLLATGVTGGLSMLMLIPIVNSLATESNAITVDLPLIDEVDIRSVPLAILLGLVVVLVSGQALLVRWASVNAVFLQQAVVDRMRSQAFGAILAARWTFVLQSRRSDLTEIATIGASRAGSAFNALLQAAVAAVVALATITISAVVSPTLTAIVLIGLAVLLLVQLRSVRPAHRLGREYGRRNRILQSVMFDSMDSLRLVRAHDAQGTWDRELREAFAGTRAIQQANVRRNSMATAVASIALIICAAALVLVAESAGVTSGTIVLILLLAARLAGNARLIASNLQIAANTLPAVDDLNDLTRRAKAEAELTSVSRSLPPVDPDVPAARLVRVCFTYPNSDEGVFDLSFDVQRGQITALVGPSGAGKSTTADLVLGLLTPTSGWIEVDGVPLTPELMRAWRERIAYVPQESMLLPGTVRRNLTWSVGGREISDDECWAALRAVSAGFATRLPAGLDTELGDRGARLSGGQRQRMALARALLRRPDLLVMDEATSALDDETESAVMDAVRQLSPRPSVLLIAHRENTIRAADHVVELANGRIVTGAGPSGLVS